ncbi:hypothetical protein [Methylibium sp.]|uniref:hypothetical protein n=1 Tax=Methylibium sp. TaxID=2067992 RepID=UPI003BA9A776
MSRSTQNTHTAAHQLRALADKLPGGRALDTKSDALLAMLRYGEPPNAALSTMAIIGRSGANTRNTARMAYQRHTLVPLLEAGLVERHAVAGDASWRLTEAGREMALSLRPVAEASVDPQAIALPRSAPSADPLPHGEYRCPRPGAYDFERCPSRMGDRLIYRDGKREVATP